jgi:hypothetical protein
VDLTTQPSLENAFVKNSLDDLEVAISRDTRSFRIRPMVAPGATVTLSGVDLIPNCWNLFNAESKEKLTLTVTAEDQIHQFSVGITAITTGACDLG